MKLKAVTLTAMVMFAKRQVHPLTKISDIFGFFGLLHYENVRQELQTMKNVVQSDKAN